MSKTYRVYAAAAAQGLKSDTGYGYVSDKYTTGKEYYTNAYTYPVSFEFNQLPDALKGLQALKRTVHFFAGSPSAKTINETKTIEYNNQTIPAREEIVQEIKDAVKIERAYVAVATLTTPIDLKSGIFSCYSNQWPIHSTVVNGDRYVVPCAVTVGSITTQPGYSYTEFTAPYSITINGIDDVEQVPRYSYIRVSDKMNGIRLVAADDDIRIYAPSEEYPAYIDIEYYEGGLVTYINSPSGYTDETGAIPFSWHTTYSGFPVEDVAQTSAQIQWKDGESGTVHNISVSGGSTEYRMAANTLPESQNILWRVVVQTAEGQSTSEWTTVQTQDSVSTAAAISPSASYVDGQKEMLFTWDHVTDTGTAQTGYEIQYKTASSDWTTAQQESAANEYAYLPAGTLPSGSVTWRVRTYNAEGIAGEWSNELTIVVIAAPKAPSVSVSVSAPRPVISWQSREQQAFEVEIGGVKSGTIYGTGKSYQWPDFLGNGTQIARVRVLNEFGIWSPWGSTSFSVSNVPSESVVSVFGTGGTDAELSWNSISEASEYWVYRNDERIAKVSGTDYTDRLYLGTASYFVRAVHADGYNYTDSNRVTLTLSVERAMITALDGDWLDIGYSLTSVPNVSVTRSQDVAMMQYNGARLPIPEVSPFEQRTYPISCAFADRQMAARFDELLGRLCCVKDQYGNCMVGMLYSYTRVQNTFTTAYTATLYEVDRSAYEEN